MCGLKKKSNIVISVRLCSWYSDQAALVWQTLGTVIVQYYTINRINPLSNYTISSGNYQVTAHVQSPNHLYSAKFVHTHEEFEFEEFLCIQKTTFF